VASLPDVTVNGVQVRAIVASSLRGSMLLSAVQGRLPAGAGQIALGASTMRTTGARIGGSVRVTVAAPSGAPRTRSFRVVGMLAFPGDFTTGGLGTGAAVTTAGYVAAQCPPGPKQAACLKQARKRIPDLVAIHAVDGPAGQAALNHYGGKQDDNATRPVIPAALVNFGESANFSLLLGGIVTLCGLATLGRAFAVSLGVVPAPVVHVWPLAAIAAGSARLGRLDAKQLGETVDHHVAALELGHHLRGH
jgi:hypothetical protein